MASAAWPAVSFGLSSGSAVLVGNARASLTAVNPAAGQCDDVGIVIGRQLLAGLIGPMRVEVDLVLVEDPRGVPAVEDQNIVEDLFASRAHEALGVRVAVRRARRDLPDLD